MAEPTAHNGLTMVRFHVGAPAQRKEVAMRAHQALVLNADFRPLNYFPLSTMNWQTAVKNVYEGNLSVVAEYDDVVRSPTVTMRIPSVVAMRDYVPIPKRVAFTRFNVFLRDRFRCQYCGGHFSADALTFDHVKPRSLGGVTEWRNVVSACDACNLKKADRLDMRPLKMPIEPTPNELNAAKRMFPPNYLHESWLDYLYWDSEIEN
jgi:5-methylcytosine-specific restriction endonuclease McrA